MLILQNGSLPLPQLFPPQLSSRHDKLPCYNIAHSPDANTQHRWKLNKTLVQINMAFEQQTIHHSTSAQHSIILLDRENKNCILLHFVCEQGMQQMINHRTIQGYSNMSSLLSLHVLLIFNKHFLNKLKTVESMQPESQWAQVYK